MSAPAARLEDVSIGYRARGGRPSIVAGGLTVELRRGELVCLLGSNGAGKSTLLRTIAGLQPALAGKIFVDGVPLASQKPRDLARRLAVVLTERTEVGALNGFAVAALGRHPYTGWSGALDDADRTATAEALRLAGAEDLAERHFSEMSDGERQRVLIARALAQQPRMMVLDEITAFLDLPRRVSMVRLLQRLTRDQGLSVLLSTHDLDLALRCADRIWLLEMGGRFHAGAPEDLALQGLFERCFSTEGVVFDSRTGSFRLDHRSTRTIRLDGDGTAGVWTRRMLERIGFEPVTGQSFTGEGVLTISDGPRWRWLRNGLGTEYHCLDDVARALAPSDDTRPVQR
jgi:iron complex transport system ATP-binding protein